MHYLIHLVVNALIILAVSKLMPGVKLRSFSTALLVAFVLGVLNFFLGKLLILLALPAIILTFGLGYIVIRFFVNVFLLWLTDKLIDGFEIEGVGNLMLASLVISVLQHVAVRLI
jgi:putative membrane protein